MNTKPEVTPSMEKATRSFLEKLAAAKIKAFNLPDTVEEYIEKSKANAAS